VRENAHTLSDFRVPTLSIECEPCGRSQDLECGSRCVIQRNFPAPAWLDRKTFAPQPFKSPRQAQRFLSVHDQVANLFHVPYPEKATAEHRRATRERAFAVWCDVSKTSATF
jgi:hypothetical protein